MHPDAHRASLTLALLLLLAGLSVTTLRPTLPRAATFVVGNLTMSAAPSATSEAFAYDLEGSR